MHLVSFPELFSFTAPCFIVFVPPRETLEDAELAKHRAERPKIQQQFADLKRGLSAVTDSEWENIPEVGNLTRKKRKRDERTFVVPDSVVVGDRAKGEYENALDERQQAVRPYLPLPKCLLMTMLIEWRFRDFCGCKYTH